MKTTEDWIKEKIAEYFDNKEESLEDMLIKTTNVIEQYVNSPNNATKELLIACLEHNKLFLNKINND